MIFLNVLLSGGHSDAGDQGAKSEGCRAGLASAGQPCQGLVARECAAVGAVGKQIEFPFCQHKLYRFFLCL